VAGAVVAWASALDAVRTADEATTPNAAAYPRKASAVRRQTCFGSERLLIVRLPVCCPVRAMSLASAAYLLIWINFAGWFKPRWDFCRWDRHSRQVRDDGPRSDDQSLAELVRAKSLADTSVSKVLVRRGCRRLDSVPSVGTSKVTYQVWFMPRRRWSWSRPSAPGSSHVAALALGSLQVSRCDDSD